MMLYLLTFTTYHFHLDILAEDLPLIYSRFQDLEKSHDRLSKNKRR